MAKRWVRPFRAFRKRPAFHFYLLQFTAFAYFAYRYASRPFQSYGLLPEDAFVFPRKDVFILWGNLPPAFFTTFQFIYWLIPRPGPGAIDLMQLTIVLSCLAGMLGLWPRTAARLAFLLGLHLVGFMQASNAETEGGEVALVAMLILSLSAKEAFYSHSHGFHPGRRAVENHWPLFLLMGMVGAFYFTSGLNKLVDIGPLWPFQLHLDRGAAASLRDSVFLTARYSHPFFLKSFAGHPVLSAVGGMATLLAELAAGLLLVVPTVRIYCVLTLIAMHLFVYGCFGINFLGSSVILLLCFDWNRVYVFFRWKLRSTQRSLAPAERLPLRV